MFAHLGELLLPGGAAGQTVGFPLVAASVAPFWVGTQLYVVCERLYRNIQKRSQSGRASTP